MRYFWALLAYVTAIVLTAASCGGNGGGNGFANTGAAGTGASTTANGGGGSSGIGITIPDAGNNTGDGGTCPAYKGDCKTQKLNCGMATDGCGNTLNCGTCTAPDSCAGSGTQNVCGHPACVPQPCPSGANCGMTTDGCNNTITCGPACPSGETCGGGGTNICGTGTTCVPKTSCPPGYMCGSVSDGCNGTIDCGTCPANTFCNGGSNPMPGICGSFTCTPKSCMDQGFNCGAATDGCGNIIQCGSCSGTQTCGGGGMSNVCGSGSVGSCTGLCLKQMMCAGAATTSISGTVYAPNGTDPLPNTLVYVPNGAAGAPTWGVQPFTDGVSPPHCDCGSDVTGSPLVNAVTDFKGNFTITNMPVGTNIPLVIQNGRWRRKLTIPNVAACVNTALPAGGMPQIRMPQVEHETDTADNIPKMGFVTGSVDALECVLRKIGIADSQFADPGGAARVQFYQGDGSAGAYYSLATPLEDNLWTTQSVINGYDMVYFACQGAEYDKNPAAGYPTAQSNVINYANAGGRIFATHYSYVWLFDDTPFSTTASWLVDQFPNFVSDPETGYIVTTFPKGQLLAQWLQYIGASTTYGQMSVQTLRDDFTAVNAATSQLWIYLQDPNYEAIGQPQKPMHYTFNTPVGAAPANQCGRVLYDDFHVEDAFTAGIQFPQECTVPGMTPQEKMLEFMIFDLGSCVTPPTCTPKSCGQQNTTCGQVGDGCGNIIQCGNCPSGQACVGGACVGNGCTPKSCQQQSFTCGMQGDGCGNVINCGTCPSGQTCGGGGMTGKCSSGTCNPTTCMAQGYMCGSIGDGCGNVLNCGVCPSGEVCGGNGMPGKCYTPPCTPKNCGQLGFNCGNASDGCGNIINCGTCSGTQTCGGGGTANVCGGGAG